jgi:hypothetical protein
LIAKSWVDWSDQESSQPLPAWDGHAAGLRTTTLVALSELVDEEWLASSIERHLDHLSSEANFDGHWNHGLVQTIGLLGAALRLADEALIKLGHQRILQTLREIIDIQGAVNEQATAYASYVEELLRTAITIFEENDFTGLEELRSRHAAILVFVAHSVDPSGKIVPLGDSYPETPRAPTGTEVEFAGTCGRRGRAPAERVAVYDRGYIFGRSGWGESRPFTDESFYSVRFGPGRIIHGHNDHMSITWYDGARPILVDSGHCGYAPGPMRDYLRSPAAHNILEIVGQRHDWAAETVLTEHSIGGDASFFSLSDAAFGGIVRKRSVLAIDKGPMIVLDRSASPGKIRHYRQLWHLSPEFTLAGSTDSSVRFSSALGDLDVAFVRFNVTPDDTGSHSGLSYWKGQRDPIRGMIARQDGDELPSPSIGFDVKTRNLFLLTAVVAIPRGAKLGYSLRPGPAGHYVLRIHVGNVSYSVNVRISNGNLSIRT